MANQFFGLRRAGQEGPAVFETLSAERILQPVSWRVTEGEDGTGQTASLSLLADAAPGYDGFLLRLSDGARSSDLYYDVLGTPSSDGAGHLYELTGTQDAFFSETYSQISASVVSRAATLMSQPPASLWVTDAVQRASLQAKLESLLRAATSLRQARQALAQYGLTLLPQTFPTVAADASSVTQVRHFALEWRYPNVGIAEIHRTLTIPAASVARPVKPREPDALNRPGLYAARPIFAGWRNPGGQVRAYAGLPAAAALDDLRRIVIDVEQATRDVALYAVRMRRWELQNDSATVTFALADPDLRIGLNTLLGFSGDYGLTGLPDYGGGSDTTWRVRKVTRSHRGPEHHATEIEAALWQGLPEA